MVRKTLTVYVEVVDGVSSVKIARYIVGWLSNPDNQPYQSIESAPLATGAVGGAKHDAARASVSKRFKVKDRVWTMGCCGLSFTEDLDLEANFTHDPRAPRLVLVCSSPQFRHYSTTWQVIETSQPSPKAAAGSTTTTTTTTLEVRGDVIIEPKRWSPASARAVRHTLRDQEERLLRSVESAQELHRIGVVAEE